MLDLDLGEFHVQFASQSLVVWDHNKILLQFMKTVGILFYYYMNKYSHQSETVFAHIFTENLKFE